MYYISCTFFTQSLRENNKILPLYKFSENQDLYKYYFSYIITNSLFILLFGEIKKADKYMKTLYLNIR